MDTAAIAEDFVGREVEDRYRVRRRIGEGAMGTVYEATALPAARAAHRRSRVAIKVMLPELATDGEAVARFTHEAYLGSRLRHPGLARTLDFGSAHGRPWFAMDLCRGTSLDRALAVRGRFAPYEAAALIADVAGPLGVLHGHGLVHRDVKPSNLFLVEGRGGARPRLMLLDLGIVAVYHSAQARRLGIVAADARLSHGTPGYLSPEQALGVPVDPRADVYSLGCVAYRMLTGLEAVRGCSAAQVVRAHLYGAPRLPSAVNSELSAAVDVVLARALAKDRTRRQTSVQELAEELTQALLLH